MKARKLQIVMVMGLMAVTLATQGKQLPEFMNAQQLTAWRAQHEAPVSPPQPNDGFFTGKPYDATSDSYLFMYRNYSATAVRWTSCDPSGFPDGPNTYAYVNNCSTCIDPDGLSCVEQGFIYTATWTEKRVWWGPAKFTLNFPQYGEHRAVLKYDRGWEMKGEPHFSIYGPAPDSDREKLALPPLGWKWLYGPEVYKIGIQPKEDKAATYGQEGIIYNRDTNGKVIGKETVRSGSFSMIFTWQREIVRAE